MKIRLVLVLALLAITIAALPVKATETIGAGPLPCSLTALLAPPVKVIPAAALFVAFTDCNEVHEYGYENYYEVGRDNCQYRNEGSGPAYSYSSCECQGARAYNRWMSTYYPECDGTRFAMLQGLEQCFLTQ